MKLACNYHLNNFRTNTIFLLITFSFTYLQIRRYISTCNFPVDEPTCSAIDTFILTPGIIKKCISLFYGTLQNFNKHNIDKVIAIWENDIRLRPGFKT